MEVMNCKSCGRMFNSIGKKICPKCERELEDKFQKVKAYIRENEKASINEIAEENEVSVQQIKRWVREERLKFSPDSQVGIECENCGALIRTGRFCDKCKAQVTNDLSSAIKKAPKVEPKKQKESARMRFLDNM